MNRRFLFVNGVNTMRGEAQDLAGLLSNLTGHPVELFYNVSATERLPGVLRPVGLGIDLAESFWNRWGHEVASTPVVERLRSVLMANLRAGCGVVLIGHSQGTAIAMNAAGLLPLELRKRVQLILFAPVNSFEARGVRVEYFRNYADAVTWLPGNRVLNFWRSVRRGEFPPDASKRLHYTRGPVFERNGTGHALRERYLDKIREFRCWELSMFHKLLKGKRHEG